MTPQRVEVVVEPATFTRSATGGITGPIWLRFDGGVPGAPNAFPEAGWSDFAVVVLGWWLTRLARETGGREAVERCEFMEGPVYFTVRRQRDEPLWEVVCFGAGRAARPTAIVESAAFVDSLATAARAVLSECTTRGWGGADVEALARAVEQATYYRAA